MSNKKNKDENKPRFQVKKREPKEKPNYFQNIPSMKHPLAEILDFPHQTINALDIQNAPLEIAKKEDPGYPKLEDTDSQQSEVGYPTTPVIDSHNTENGYPNQSNQDSQGENTGYPKNKVLDSNISKTKKRISKNEGYLDSNISKTKNLDIQKKEEANKWEKYDKNRKRKGTFLRTGEEITKKFKQFCIENDWDFSHGTELAWNKIMSDLAIQKPGGLDSLIALDDRRLKMLYKSKPFIINLYLAYNTIFNEFSSGKSNWKPRWTPRDDEAGQKLNDSDIALVELGIIQTQINKGAGQGRIQTFKYYMDEIENFLQAEINPETARTILEVNRKMWKNQFSGKEIDLTFLESKE